MYMHVYLCVSKYVHVCTGATGVRKGCRSPWSWSYRQLWVLGIELGSSARAIPTFNHGIISSASLDSLLKYFLIKIQRLERWFCG